MGFRLNEGDCGRTPGNFAKSLQMNAQEVAMLKVCAVFDTSCGVCSVEHILSLFWLVSMEYKAEHLPLTRD
jgi:hypothetical protein